MYKERKEICVSTSCWMNLAEILTGLMLQTEEVPPALLVTSKLFLKHMEVWDMKGIQHYVPDCASPFPYYIHKNNNSLYFNLPKP